METSESKTARHIIYTRIMSNLCTPQGRRRGLYNGSAECKLNLCRTAKQSEAKINNNSHNSNPHLPSSWPESKERKTISTIF